MATVIEKMTIPDAIAELEKAAALWEVMGKNPAGGKSGKDRAEVHMRRVEAVRVLTGVARRQMDDGK